MEEGKEDAIFEIHIITNKISRVGLAKMAEGQYGNMVKAVVDVGRKVMAIGGELHADAERALMEQGARHDDLWGINLYPGQSLRDELIEFDSLINIRPRQGNRSRGIEDPVIRDRVIEIVASLVE